NADHAEHEQELRPEEAEPGGSGDAAPQAEHREHQAEGDDGADDQRQRQDAFEPATPDRLDGRAEQLDKPVGFHGRPCLPIRSASFLNPRCTVTLTADSDMPERAAASLTLSPSSLTSRMACRVLGDRSAISFSRSWPLSTPAISSCARTSAACSMGTSWIEAL